ncbi:carboxypeptidase-like regulatory domain-containing protein [Flavobacterium alkalisoli]|uniref:Carboxypeptidase-like regulatory domain-containing protein n=1 Tax=Flavobacterium alkalisoli TaxID=2602769 RepID=A0A5B9FUA6_9FLAO|nr:carboxypeptidase-like regulatory domain-containing protein [Flavobacterium alkalisoli]QEE50903.1 carboxypeptidase-like regulatory domain-containing protein [Flavobacterium alkalisoli]
MRYFVVILFLILSFPSFAQEKKQEDSTSVSGTIVNNSNMLPLENATVINVNSVKGVVTDSKGYFTLNAKVNDTIHITLIGFQPIKVRVTNDWIKNTTSTKIPLTEKAYALEEVVINKYGLTGYLQVDSKLVPVKENHRYSISGLNYGYEGGPKSPSSFKKIISSVFNPADFLHNVFGKKPKEMRRLREMKKDDTVRNLLATKFDRETLAALLGVMPEDIAEILENCNYSEEFIRTANDLQIMDAISSCYEEYKALNRDKN